VCLGSPNGTFASSLPNKTLGAICFFATTLSLHPPQFDRPNRPNRWCSQILRLRVHLIFSNCLLRSVSYCEIISLETCSQKCSICVLTLRPRLSPVQIILLCFYVLRFLDMCFGKQSVTFIPFFMKKIYERFSDKQYSIHLQSNRYNWWANGNVWMQAQTNSDV
jgi:hypothetical protein